VPYFGFGSPGSYLRGRVRQPRACQRCAHPHQSAHERNSASPAPARAILGRAADAKASAAYPLPQKHVSTHAHQRGPDRNWGETTRALGKASSRFSNVFEYVNTTPVPTHTSYRSHSSEFSPLRSPSPSTSQQRSQFSSQPSPSLHNIATTVSNPRSQIASLSLNSPTPPSRIASTPSDLRRTSARPSVASQHDRHLRHCILRTPRHRILGSHRPTIQQRARTRSTRAPTAPESSPFAP
jgi:hypothetical protein